MKRKKLNKKRIGKAKLVSGLCGPPYKSKRSFALQSHMSSVELHFGIEILSESAILTQISQFVDQ